MNNRTVYENIGLLAQTKLDISTAIENKGAVVANDMVFADFAELIINDISTCYENKDWSYIGYDGRPSYIDDGVRYAKYMIKNRKGFPGISEHIINVSNNLNLVYLPSCKKLGVDRNNISYLSFNNCVNLKYIADKELNGQLNNIQNIFENCISLKYVPKLDISTYTTSGTGLFQNLYALETIDPSNNTEYWYNTGGVNKGFKYLFYNCHSLKTLPVIDCGKLPAGQTTMENMFSGCRSLTDVSIINTSNVTNMLGLFLDCRSLMNVPQMDTQNVSDMGNMFYNCRSLTNIPLMNTINTNYMDGMFYGCRSLTNIPLMDTRNVSTMASMFNNCTSLTTIPLMNTTNVKNMSNMFSYCTSLTTIPLIDTGNVTTMSYMFNNCTSLTNIPLMDTENVTNMEDMFYNCSLLTSIPQIDTQNVKNMQSMFSGCRSLTTIPLIDTGNVTNMSYMFNNCRSLTTVPQLNTENVTNMNGIFFSSSVTIVEGLDFKSISSEANSRIVSTSYKSIIKLYIKNIGYSSCPTYDFSTISGWGINNSTIPDASLSIYKSLVEDTSNRVNAGSSTVNIKLNTNVLDNLDNTAKAAICAKGYTLNGISY